MNTETDALLPATPAILIIGDVGTRKTRFLYDAAESGFRPYVFDFDKGMSVLRGAKGIDYDTFIDAPYGSKVVNTDKGWYKFGSAWPAFIKKLNEIGADMETANPKYNLIGFDSLTTMANAAMAYVQESEGKGNKTPELQHYNVQMQLVEKTLQQLTSWEIMKVVTAHIQRTENDITQATEMLPLVTGKLSGKIGIYFDDIYYAKVDPSSDAKWQQYGKPTLVTNQDKLMKQAKSRYGVKTGTETRFGAVWEQIDKKLKEQKVA